MKVTSVVAIAAIDAVVKRLGIVLSAKRLPISMAIELGHFLIERDFFGQVDAYDGTGAIDEMLFDFFKTVTDSAAAAEDAVWAFNKVLADVPGLTDIEVFEFYKNLADLTTFTDEHRTDFSKALTSEVTAIGDHAYAYVKKAKADTANVAEEDYKSFYKALTEAPSLVDAIDTVAFFKNTQDTAGFSDIETFAFAKFLFDNVNSTDDVDGAASVLDDQEMQYHKNTTNIARLTDVFFRVVQYSREFTDASRFTDDDTLLVGKSLASNSGAADYIDTFDFGKDLINTAAVTDANSITSSKDATDGATFTDTLATMLAYVRGHTDSANLSDVTVWGVGKELSDNTIFNELHHRDFGKLLVENPTLGDALSIQLTLAPFSDTANVTDTYVNGVGKNFTNTASLADTGSLRSQGYSDFTFFAEDYVGSSRNF
jgi:hypothetical protein